MIKDYIKTYSDIETAEKWLKKNIEQSNVPPVSFKMGDKHSSECKWIKTVEEKKTAVDFPESDEPAARIFYDIVYTSKELGVEVRLTVTSYPDYPIVEYSAEMKNISGAVSPVVEEFYSVRGGILDADEAILHHTAGGFYGERCFEAKTAVLKEGAEFELCSDNGMASMGYLPFMNAEDTEGEKGVIVAVNSSGDWTAAYKAEEGSIKAACGYRFLRLSMLEGETLYFPGIVLLFYKDCDWQYGQNIWRRWLIKHNMMRYVGNRDFKENVYLGSAFPGTATDLNFIETAIEAGLNEDFNCVVEYDAPWYETYGQDWGNTGDYRPAVQYANGGLNRISNKCHENGMKIAFWMEPERPKYDTAQCKELGDDNVIYLHSPDQPNTTYWFDGIRYIPHSECVETGFDPGFNCLLNYSKKASVDYVADLVDSVVKSYGVDVYRQDFNANNGPFWRVYDEYEEQKYGIPRKGATGNAAAEGYRKVWREVSSRNPGLVFDACAGGGRRHDLETVRFSFEHTKSDWVEPVLSAQCQNFGAYSWYIFTGTGLCAPADNYDTRSRLTLSIGVPLSFCGDVGTYVKGLREWKSLHKYLYKDYYQISEQNYDEDGKMAMQFHDHEKEEGMMVAYLRKGGDYAFNAKALESDAEYKIWDGDKPETECVLTGKEIMNGGFKVSYEEGTPYASVVWYRKA